MTVREAISRVTSLRDEGVSSDDSRLRPRWAYSVLRSARAAVLRDELRKRNSLSEFNYTTIPCAELEKVSAHQCGCIEAAGCYYFRVKCTLPASIGDTDTQIADVTTLDGRVRFSPTQWRAAKYHSSDRYTSASPRFFIRNNQIYLIGNEPELKYVTIRGLFEDPVEALSRCRACAEDEGKACIEALDQEFSIEPDLFQKVAQITYAELFGVQGREDTTSNRRDTPKDISK